VYREAKRRQRSVNLQLNTAERKLFNSKDKNQGLTKTKMGLHCAREAE
jgi:hypothetical protein